MIIPERPGDRRGELVNIIGVSGSAIDSPPRDRDNSDDCVDLPSSCDRVPSCVGSKTQPSAAWKVVSYPWNLPQGSTGEETALNARARRPEPWNRQAYRDER